MKNKQLLLPKILLLFGIFFLIPNQSDAQILKRLKQKAEKKIEREAEKRAERRMNKKIDKEFDKAEDVLDGKKKKGAKTENGNNNQNTQGNNQNSENISQENEAAVKKPNVSWSRFDFVPGDTVIFEDEPSADEENGEFPSRWDLFKGGAEIVEIDGVPAITLITDIANMHSKGIVPYLKDSKEDYLPEVFTIEFDGYYHPNEYNERMYITLRDKKNQPRNDIKQITIYVNEISMGDSTGTLSGKKGNKDKVAGWHHISIAYTKGKLKIYLNEERLINIPHLEGNPTGITFSMGSKDMYMKNFRIAKGGVKYYDRVLSEGKIVVNGIKFDVNKATLKAESMGPINKIYELMQKQPDLNFSVEGHTDADGNDDNNQTLSEARGKAVMNKLIEMGIASTRLKSNGFGESKPIDNNSTPEEKANNRRVEFVKFSGKSNNTSTNSTSASNNGSATFNQLDKKTIAAKLESLPDSFNIPISNNDGIVNGKGTVILYATTGGKFGKMEILDVDPDNNYELTVKYVTYNYNGSVYSKTNLMQIEGTYGCELDEGYSGDVDFEDAEFFLGRQGSVTTSLNPTETAILKIYK